MKLRIAWLAVALSAAAILLATLHPAGRTVPPGWSFALASGEAAIAELLQNLILFIPFGAAFAAAVPRRPVAAVLIGALLSFSVEFAQQWIPGRDPSVGDIVCNTASTAIGVGLVRLAPHWLTVSPARSGRQALGAAALAVLVWLGSAAALRPMFPPPPYYIEPRPDYEFWGHYRGQVLEARMSGGMLYAKATFPDRPPRRRSPLAAVLDKNGNRATILAVAGRDLMMRYTMPALKLRLVQPDLVWQGALSTMAPADTFIASTGRDVGHLCMAVNTEWRCNLGYTIGDGWKLIFYPEHWPGWLLAFINACWVAGWTVGVGFWAGRTSGAEHGGGANSGGEGRRRAAKIAVAIILLGMIVVPMTTHLKATALVEWIGALLGLELGLVLGSRTWNDLINRPA